MSRNILGKRVKVLDKRHDGIIGTVVEELKNQYKIKLDNKIGGCEYYIAPNDELTVIEEIEENVQIRHVTIRTEKLKQLINDNYKWNDYTLKGKIDIVTSLAYFENDKELLEFLEYMEEKKNYENRKLKNKISELESKIEDFNSYRVKRRT